MTQFRAGFLEAQEVIRQMSRDELLDYLEGFYRTDQPRSRFAWPTEEPTEEIRKEALRQCRQDFTEKDQGGWR